MSQSSAPSSDAPDRRTALFIAFILLAGAAARILYLMDFASLPLMDHPAGPDIGEYCEEAAALLHGGTLPAQDQIHAPLYPVFLAFLMWITGKNFFLIRLLQSLLCLGSGLLYFPFLKANDAGPKKYIPHLFLLLYAFYPPFLIWQCDFYSENLLFPLFGCTLFLLRHAKARPPGKRTLRLFAAAGAASACAALAHPLSLAFTAGAALYLFFRSPVSGERRKEAVFFALAAGAVLLPCAAIRSFQAGKPVLIQQHSSFNFYLGNHEKATGTCCIPPGDRWNRIHAEASGAPDGSDRYFARESLRFITGSPLRWLKLMGRKLILPFYRGELTTWSDVTCLGLLRLHRIAAWCFPLIALPGLAAFFLSLADAEYRKKYDLFLVLGISSFLMQVLLLTSGRYRMPLVLALMASAPWFFLSLPAYVRGGTKQFLRVLCALSGAALIVFLPVHTPDEQQERDTAQFILACAYHTAHRDAEALRHLAAVSGRGADSEIWNLLGTIELENGKLAEAEQAFLKAEACYADHPATEINLGRIAELKGDDAEALRRYTAAERGSTPRIAAHAAFNSGVILQKAGRIEEAEKQYVKAVNMDPLSARPLRNLAILYLEQGRMPEAGAALENALRLEPAEPERKLDYAYFLYLSGRAAEGRALTESVLLEAPKNERAKELRALFRK